MKKSSEGRPRLIGARQVVADVRDQPDLGKVPIRMLRTLGPRCERPDLDHRGVQQCCDDRATLVA
jgi:hypothetical protein